MDINEKISSGAYRVWSPDESLWDRKSFWTKAEDTEFTDGDSAETKLGAISGITSSVAANDASIAASTEITNKLNSDINSLNGNGAITGMDVREDGVYITYVPTTGADAVSKKLGSVERITIAENATNGTYSVVDLLDNYADLTADNFIFAATKIKTWGSYKNNGTNWSGTNSVPSKEAEVSIAYDASTGAITLSNCSISSSHSGQAGVGANAYGQVYGTIYYYPS